MKKRILSIALALVATCSFAQLSERENDATMVKLGARPQAGNLSLTFGYDFGGLVDSTKNSGAEARLFTGNFLAAGDFLTFKYYQSDDLAIRFAIRLSKHSNKLKGEALTDSTNWYDGNDPGDVSETLEKSNNRSYVFVPGIEKHFSTSNIFDVYMGADLYLGFSKEDYDSVHTRTNGDYDKYKWKKSSTIIGIGGVVGFNVFVAHLPISVGLEYGLNLKWTLGGRYKVERSYKAGSTQDQSEYQVDALGDAVHYKKLKKSKFDMDTNQDVRLVLNLYFAQ